MDTLTIAAIVILIAIALLIVLSPLWQRTHAKAAYVQDDHTDGGTIEEYQARYQAILASIKELQFDYSLGKVSDEDYEPLLNEAKLEAAQVRQQLDRLARSDQSALISPTLDTEIESLIAQARNGSGPHDEDLLADVEAEIERLKTGQPEVQRQAKRRSSAPCIHCGHALHPEALFCSYCGQAVADTCPQCNYAYQPGDAFCAQCGAALPENVNTPTVEKSKT